MNIPRVVIAGLYGEGGKTTRNHVVLKSILNLPFRENVFDTAFMADTSFIIKPEDRKQVYKEAKRTTKKFYDFLAEEHTYMPFIMPIFKEIYLPL